MPPLHFSQEQGTSLQRSAEGPFISASATERPHQETEHFKRGDDSDNDPAIGQTETV